MGIRIYNTLKPLNRLVVPGAGTIYWGLSKAFALPHESVVLGLFIVVAAILGVILQVMGKKYEGKHVFQGELVVTETREGKKVFSLELDKAPEELARMDSITFKVVDIPKQALAD